MILPLALYENRGLLVVETKYKFMFLSKSGADFLESCNAERIDENRLKLLEIEKHISSYDSFTLIEAKREIRRLKSLILRGEIWLKKCKSLEK